MKNSLKINKKALSEKQTHPTHPRKQQCCVSPPDIHTPIKTIDFVFSTEGIRISTGIAQVQ